MDEVDRRGSVVHCKKSAHDIYIGRGSGGDTGLWGNPYRIGVDGDREDVIRKYRRHALLSPQILQRVGNLRGKTLGCWCAPEACHGDVLVDLAQRDYAVSMRVDGSWGAEYSRCSHYRWRLWRRWGVGERILAFLMLNPSTATDAQNDPTISRCIRFAMDWGYDGLEILNLFAYRATAPEVMKAVEDPVGAENDRAIDEVVDLIAEKVVCAWGANGGHLGRADAVMGRLLAKGIDLYCLKRNADGSPGHPLYITADTKPIPLGR